MKKWIIAALICLLAFAIAFYVFIPSTIRVQKSVSVNISLQAIRRVLIENKDWNKGWPGSDSNAAIKTDRHTVFFNDNGYTLIDRKYSSLILVIHRGQDTIATSSLNIFELSKGIVKLDWGATILCPTSPVQRWNTYQQAKKIEADMGTLLNIMDSFYSKIPNVYGIAIRQEPVIDTTLLSVYDSSKGYPGTDLIYSLIKQLKSYIAGQGANVTGYPMLNIFTSDGITYLTKVALPVDKKLPSSGRISYKWMLPHGNILVSEVKGGQKTIDHAFQQMDYYMKDFGRDAPAIPFISLVTDRQRETDSSKWVTRVYFPVME